MKLDQSKFRRVHGYEEGKIDTLDPVSAALALDYKKNVLKNFTAIDQHQILDRLAGTDYFVTRKYDGEYAIIFHDGDQTVTVNRSGRTRRGIPCIEEAGRLLRAADIRQGVFPAEYKTRVNDLIHALAHKDRIDTLRLAVFDVPEIDGKRSPEGDYEKKWNQLREIFAFGKLVHPVDYRPARSGHEILNIYRQWVEQEGSEGLIVHSRLPFSYKVKPRHNLDVVAIGYKEGSGGETGQVRTMLIALMPRAGRYQIMTRVGSGLNEAQRRELFRYFKGKTVGNPFGGVVDKYAEVTMVRPELVIEVTVGEIVTEIASGERTNYLLSLDDHGYRIEGVVPGFKTYAPVFERLRSDKSPDPVDVGICQFDRYLYGRQPERKSELLLRDVLTRNTDRLTIAIWKRKEEYLLLIAQSQDNTTDRRMFRSGDFFDLFTHYQRAVSEALRVGFSRCSEQTIFSDTCREIMQGE